jgi:hypothetical protein
MKALLAFAWFVSIVGIAAPAAANIPVDDAAQLTQRSETAGATVKLVPITTQRQDANQGVKCAVTTGKKASIADPTVPPQAGAGSRTIQAYAPQMPAAPAADAKGAALSSQTLFKATGDVVAGLDASRSTLDTAQTGFLAAGQLVGTATTVMAALDMNSAARLQNNLAWNGATGSANLWVTALNAMNLAMTSDMSRAATAMRSGSTPPSGSTSQVCPVGMVGSATAADPCRPATTCSTTPAGTPTDPACVTSRYTDSDGNVLFYLARIQDGAQTAAGPDPASPAAATPLSVTDVDAALASIQSGAR